MKDLIINGCAYKIVEKKKAPVGYTPVCFGCVGKDNRELCQRLPDLCNFDLSIVYAKA